MHTLLDDLTPEELSRVTGHFAADDATDDDAGGLRVATVCSGSDSPVIALRLVRDALKERLSTGSASSSSSSSSSTSSGTLQVHHTFGCEISQMKRRCCLAVAEDQGSLVMFKDVLQLGKTGKGEVSGGFAQKGKKTVEKKVTAHVKVPGTPLSPEQIGMRCSLLIAGTSCKDFSKLNIAPKGLTGGGESDETFHATIKLVNRLLP